MRKISLLIVFLLIGFVVTSYAQERIEKTFTGVDNIRLTTASGNGVIKKGSGSEIKVVVEFTYDEDDYTPEFEQRGSTLVIEEEFRRSRWTRGSSEWTLEVPDGLDVEFQTGSGNIEIMGLEVSLDANTGSGNIEFDGLSGDLQANTGSGNITVYKSNAPIDANTGSGSIRISDLTGDANLNTGSGNIRLRNAEGRFSLNTGSGNLEADGVTITGKSSFNTGSGNSEVILAAELNHDLSLNTGSGNAILDFNGQPISGQFRLESNDEDNIRAPFSFDESYEDSDRGWRGRDKRYIKEAKVGNKDIRIKISTGSGRAEVRK